MRLRPIAILIGAVATLALSACAKVVKDSQDAAPLTTLAGSEWAPEMAADTPSKAEQFVAFKAEGEVIGHGGCNRFFGSYSQEGDALSFGPLASTRMACPDMTSEYAFLETLKNTRAVEATHLKLVLKGEGGETLMTLRRRDWD